MVKVAPNADTPVVQGLIGALENVVGLQVILLWPSLIGYAIIGNPATSA